MAVTSSIQMIGDKAVIGALDTSFLPGVPKVFPGTLVSNGPVYLGAVPNIGIPMAAVMIGPPMNIPTPNSLQVDGISIFIPGFLQPLVIITSELLVILFFIIILITINFYFSIILFLVLE